MDDKYTSKLSPTVDLWAGIYLVVIAVLSVLGNASVLLSAGRRLPVLRPPQLLTVNLALTDMGMALSMYPLSIASAFNHAWMGGDASCLYYGLMGMIFSITSIMTLAVMGMIRYLVTGRPPRKGVQFQKKTMCVVICSIWLYACLWAVSPLLGWGSYGPEPFGLACSVNWTGYGDSLNNATFIMALAVLCTVLPYLLIFFTYFGIAWKLHKAYKSISSSDFQYANIERRITLMAVMISLGFLIAWTPYVAVSFWSMQNSQKQDHMAPSITLLPCLFAKSSTAYNPFIYFIFQRNTGHRLPPFHRLGLSCLDGADLTEEEEKAENKTTTGSDCAGFGPGTCETCAGFAGDQPQRERPVLG